MDNALCCSCGEIVIKSMDDSIKVRSKVIIFKDNKAIAVCKSCSCEIEIPIKIDVELAKSLATSKNLRLYIKK